VLTSAEYFARYLGYDDVGVFEAVSRDRELGWSPEQVVELVALKGDKLQQMLTDGEVLFVVLPTSCGSRRPWFRSPSPRSLAPRNR
jgi:hypothetical protein